MLQSLFLYQIIVAAFGLFLEVSILCGPSLGLQLLFSEVCITQQLVTAGVGPRGGWISKGANRNVVQPISPTISSDYS